MSCHFLVKQRCRKFSIVSRHHNWCLHLFHNPTWKSFNKTRFLFSAEIMFSFERQEAACCCRCLAFSRLRHCYCVLASTRSLHLLDVAKEMHVTVSTCKELHCRVALLCNFRASLSWKWLPVISCRSKSFIEKKIHFFFEVSFPHLFLGHTGAHTDPGGVVRTARWSRVHWHFVGGKIRSGLGSASLRRPAGFPVAGWTWSLRATKCNGWGRETKPDIGCTPRLRLAG